MKKDIPAAHLPLHHPCLQDHQGGRLVLDLPHDHENQDHHEDLGDLLFPAHQQAQQALELPNNILKTSLRWTLF